MLRRTFTIAQANALVPWLTEQFEETRKLAKELRTLRLDLAESEQMRSIDIGGRTINVEPSPELVRRIGEVESEIKTRLEETLSLGIEVRRVDGLVDFPAWLDGQMVYLCWKYGDAEIAFWHETTKGFESRRSLPDSAMKLKKPELN